jgi:hypothetical protein
MSEFAPLLGAAPVSKSPRRLVEDRAIEANAVLGKLARPHCESL